MASRRVERTHTTLVVDGNHLAYRSFWKMRGLKSSQGLESGALFGALRTLRTLVIKFSPRAVVVVFDGRAVRQKGLLTTYKSQRDPKMESFYKQVKDIRKVFRALGIPCVRDPESEADPLISALAGHFAQIAKHKVIIISSDSDFYQCLENGILQYDAIRDRTISKQIVLAKYDLKDLNQVMLMKAIMGDRSDNIPPVKRGVGPKTAVQIIKSHERYMEFAHKNGKLLQRNIQLVMLPQGFRPQEGEVVPEIPKWIEKRLKPRSINYSKLRKLVRKYELKSVEGNLKSWCQPFQTLFPRRKWWKTTR